MNFNEVKGNIDIILYTFPYLSQSNHPSIFNHFITLNDQCNFSNCLLSLIPSNPSASESASDVVQ